MKAAIVLLADYKTQNFIRKMVFELNHDYGVEFFASLLPAHVSLKQPFAFECMEMLETYFDSLAEQIPPFEIRLDGIYYTEWSGYGILGLNVVETPLLRGLHDQVNAGLSQIVANSSAPHDGEGYQFHLTVELGGVEKHNPYRAYFDRVTDKNVKLSFNARELGLFYYAAPNHDTFIHYRVQPLTGKATGS